MQPDQDSWCPIVLSLTLHLRQRRLQPVSLPNRLSFIQSTSQCLCWFQPSTTASLLVTQVNPCLFVWSPIWNWHGYLSTRVLLRHLISKMKLVIMKSNMIITEVICRVFPPPSGHSWGLTLSWFVLQGSNRKLREWGNHQLLEATLPAHSTILSYRTHLGRSQLSSEF